MTAEGAAKAAGDAAEAARQSELKEQGQQQLQTISTKYEALMKQLRESGLTSTAA